MEDFLTKIDNSIYEFLLNNVSIMPMRLCKLIAYYYTDARIRKLYLERLNVKMGEGTFANVGFVPMNDGTTPIHIGKNVSIAANFICVASSSANNGELINNIDYVKTNLTKSAPVIIKDEVWIGANVTVLPGVTIGECSVIGAGSVVTKDVEPYSIYAGVPAKKIKSLINGDTYDK